LAPEWARLPGQSELRTRVVSAAILAPVAIAAVIAGGLPFAALVTLVAAIAFWEWTAVVEAYDMPATRWAALALLVAGLLALALVRASWASAVIAGPVLFFVAIGIFLPRLRWLSRGMAYVAVPSAAFIVLRQAEPFGWAAILFILIVVWATDIAAYFGGRTLGGPKLWPRVSPKKTWSGALTGLAAAVAAGGLMVALTGAGDFRAGLALAVPLSIAAQAGDLFESAVKRRFGAKDSGTIIPGHGGVLDRVDGLFGAATLAWLIAVLGFGGVTLALPGSVVPIAGGGS
jgi:phosphatidate cytidylyltransferase